MVSSPSVPAPVRSPTPAAAPNPTSPTADGGETTIVAPMPGILVSFAVEVGQTVSAGETILILEAMKMQNALPAPIAGTVKALPVVPGTQVAKDDVLAIIATSPPVRLFDFKQERSQPWRILIR